MRKLFAIAAAAALLGFSGPAFAQSAGDSGANGSFSVAPPNGWTESGPYEVAPRGWTSDPYWGAAPLGNGLPRYAQSAPDAYWPGPQGWEYFPGPL